MYLLSIDTQDVIVFYNKDVFDAKGIAYPPKSWDDPDWTYDRVVEIGQQIAGGEGIDRVFAYDTSRWWVYYYPDRLVLRRPRHQRRPHRLRADHA